MDARAGYTYGEGDYGDGGTREHHAIDAGVNYNRALSISRQTTLSFGTGTSALRTLGNLRFTITGNARLATRNRSQLERVGWLRTARADERDLARNRWSPIGLRRIARADLTADAVPSSIRAALGKQGRRE